MEPLLIVQAYDAPAVTDTEAERPVAFGQAVAGAVIAAGGVVQAGMILTAALPLSLPGVVSLAAPVVALKVSVPAEGAVTLTPTGAVVEAASDVAEQLIDVAELVHELQSPEGVMLLIVPPVTVTVYVTEVAGLGPAFVAPRVAVNGVPAVADEGTEAKDGETSAGGRPTVKLVALIAVPPAVVRLIGPVVLPVATTAVTWVALLTL